MYHTLALRYCKVWSDHIKAKLVCTVFPYRPYKLVQQGDRQVLADHKRKLLVRLEVIAALVGDVSFDPNWFKVV